MKTHTFTYKEIFNSAWSKTKEHAWFLFRAFLIAVLIMGAGKFLFILSPFIDLLVSIAILTISLIIAHGKTPVFSDLLRSFENYKITWHYLLASLLSVIIIGIGILLLVLPGIYLAVRLQFYKFLIIEHENMGVIESLKKSMAMTQGKFWKLFGFMILVILFNILGLIPFGLGLIFTIPISILAHAFLYKKLALQTHTAKNTVS